MSVANHLKFRRINEHTRSKQLAASAGIKYTTFISQEKAGSPSVKLMTFYLKAFMVDYNFILGGDPARLPADVREAILAELD